MTDPIGALLLVLCGLCLAIYPVQLAWMLFTEPDPVGWEEMPNF